MSAQALNYVLNSYLSSNDRLKVYYNFETGNSGVFAVQSGATYQAYIKNQFPAYNSEIYNGKIHLATGISSGAAMSLATGSNGFIRFGTSGNFAANNVIISGAPEVSFKDTSLVISFSNSLDNNIYQDGLLFGSLQTADQTILGNTYSSASGFNIGVNDRGKLFFQSVGVDGPFIFCADSIELSKKNIVGVSVGANEVKILRFDYLNSGIQSETFPLNTDDIKNPTEFYLGSSPSYYKITSPLQKTWSGCIDEFALLSGKLDDQILFNIGKSFISEYSYTSGAVTLYSGITGYTPTVTYNTGITGQNATITGYLQIPNNFSINTGSVYATGTLSLREGDRYYNYYAINNSFGSGFYKEQQGYLSPTFASSYNPTGESASGILGLQTGLFSVPLYQEITGSTGIGYTQIPLYQINNLTGFTTEITGYINTPLYQTGYITGQASSGIVLSGDSQEFKKDYLYYLSARL